jgi:hypothetical protein
VLWFAGSGICTFCHPGLSSLLLPFPVHACKMARK